MRTESKLINFFYQNIALAPANKPTITQSVLGLITPFTTLLVIILLASNIPYYDQWRFIPLLTQLHDSKIGFEDIWAQHNEHRILFPRLLMLVLASISDWDIRVEIGVIWLLALTLYFFLCKAMSNHFAFSRHPYTLYIAFSVLTFSMVQAENWLWGWQLTVFMSVLFTVIGFYILAFRPFEHSISLIAAIFCGIVATFSFANGLLYWPVGLILILLINCEKRWLIIKSSVWLIISLVIYFFYFLNFKKVGHHPPLIYGLLHPVDLVIYYILFLGSPICQIGRLMLITFIVGLTGLSTVVYFVYILWKQGQLFNRVYIFWHGLLLYVALTGAITALGRSGFGLEQAMSGRYVTISNLFWMWIIVVGYLINLNKPNWNGKTTLLIFILVTTLIALSSIRNLKVCMSDRQKLLMHQQQLRNEKLNMKTLKEIYKESPELVSKGNKELKRYNLSFYAHQN